MAITNSRLTQYFNVNNKKCSIEAVNSRFKNSELKVLVVSKTTRIPFFGEIPPVHPEKLNYVIATKFCTEFCEAYIKPKELESVIHALSLKKKHQQLRLMCGKDFDNTLKFVHEPLRKQKKRLNKKSERGNRKRSKRLTKIRKRNRDLKFKINTGLLDNSPDKEDFDETTNEDFDETTYENWQNEYDYFDICDYNDDLYDRYLM